MEPNDKQVLHANEWLNLLLTLFILLFELLVERVQVKPRAFKDAFFFIELLLSCSSDVKQAHLWLVFDTAAFVPQKHQVVVDE